MPIETKNGKLRVRVRQKSGSTPFYYWPLENREDAQRWLDVAKEDVKCNRKWPCPSEYGSTDTILTKAARTSSAAWTLRQAFDKKMELDWEGSPTEGNYIKNWKQVSEFFGANTLLADVTLDDVDAFVITMKRKGNSGGTINRKLSLLSSIWTTAHQRQKAPQRVSPWPRQQESEGRLQFWTTAEEQRIFQACNRLGFEDLRDYLLILLDTGIRRGEAAQLSLSNIASGQLDMNFGNTRTKRHTRSIPLTARALEVLRNAAKESTSKLFPRTTQYYNKRWTLVQHLAKVEGCMHVFRHTYASRLAQSGASLVHIQQLMGHKSVKATMIYAHLCTGALQNTVEHFMTSEFFNADSHLSG